MKIEEALAALGTGTHPAEVTVEPDDLRQIRLVVRPKYSSRTFVLIARVDNASEV